MHPVPNNIVDILKMYFSDFKMRCQTANYVTKFIQMQVEIAMGCKVSPTLFVLTMKILLKATEASTEQVKLGQGMYTPPLMTQQS